MNKSFNIAAALSSTVFSEDFSETAHVMVVRQFCSAMLASVKCSASESTKEVSRCKRREEGRWTDPLRDKDASASGCMLINLLQPASPCKAILDRVPLTVKFGRF